MFVTYKNNKMPSYIFIISGIFGAFRCHRGGSAAANEAGEKVFRLSPGGPQPLPCGPENPNRNHRTRRLRHTVENQAGLAVVDRKGRLAT